MTHASGVPGHGERPIDVVVIGSFMKDFITLAPRRPREGETIRGTGFVEALGGKGLNQAVAAARAGARVAMVGRVGADRHGREFLALLRAEDIDAAQVSIDQRLGTGVGLPIVQPDGANSIIIVPRANDGVDIGHVRRAADLLESSRVLLVQLELPVAATIEALAIASSRGTQTVLNPAPSIASVESLVGLADIVVPNEIEAEQLTGIDCAGDGAFAAARQLARTVARRAGIITLGERGAVVGERTGPHEVDVTLVPGHHVPVVDTIGAGDAFCGALGSRLAAGDDLLSAVTFANAAGALATLATGAVPALPSAESVERFLDQVRA